MNKKMSKSCSKIENDYCFSKRLICHELNKENILELLKVRKTNLKPKKKKVKGPFLYFSL